MFEFDVILSICMFMCLFIFILQQRQETELSKLKEKVAKTKKQLDDAAPKYEEQRQREESAATQ